MRFSHWERYFFTIFLSLLDRNKCIDSVNSLWIFVSVGAIFFWSKDNAVSATDGSVNVSLENRPCPLFEINDEIVDGSDYKYPEVKLPASNLINYSTIDDVLKIFNEDKDAVILISNENEKPFVNLERIVNGYDKYISGDKLPDDYEKLKLNFKLYFP